MRRADWLDRLWETIEARRALPFRWGEIDGAHDCCTFVAACVDAMTDSNLVAALRAEYHDQASANEYIARCGGLEAAISSHLGRTKPVAFMKRGDVAIVEVGGIRFAGICIGPHVVSAGPEGLGMNPATCALTVWGI
jgi:hypothetical protein